MADNDDYIQAGSNPYNGYLHADLNMKNPTGGAREQTDRMIGGKRNKLLKNIGKGALNVAKNSVVPIATTVIEKSLTEGGKRKRGRPLKVLGDVGKATAKVAVPVVSKVAEKQLEKGIHQLVENMMEAEANQATTMEGGRRKKFNFGKALKKVAKHPITKSVAREVYDIAMPIIREQGKKMVKEGMDNLVSSLAQNESMEERGGRRKKGIGNTFKKIGKKLAPTAVGIGATVYTGNPIAGIVASEATKESLKGTGRAKRKPSARNLIVKKIMAERGVNLPTASKIVKEEGLY